MNINAKNRQQCTNNPLASKTLKTLSSMIYGKSIQRSENYIKATVVYDSKSYQREVNKFTFKKSIDFENHVSLVVHKRTSYTARTPCYLGWCILQISKLLVARYYYDHLLPLAYYNNVTKCELSYTDTDSIFYCLHYDSKEPLKGPPGDPGAKGPLSNYYQLLRDLAYISDMSVYPEDHPVFTSCSDPEEKKKLLRLRETSYKELGRWADETPSGYALFEMVSFRPKSYSAQFQKICPPACFNSFGEVSNHHVNNHDTPARPKEKMRFKGCVSRLMPHGHRDYMQFLLGKTKYDQLYMYYQHRAIRSRSHRLFLESSRRVITNKLITKRYLLACGLISYPIGHHFAILYEECWLCLDEIINKICCT